MTKQLLVHISNHNNSGVWVSVNMSNTRFISFHNDATCYLMNFYLLYYFSTSDALFTFTSASVVFSVLSTDRKSTTVTIPVWNRFPSNLDVQVYFNDD